MYFDGRDSKKLQHQFKLINVSKLFEPHYHPTPIIQQPPFSSVTKYFGNCAPDFAPQIDGPLQQKGNQKEKDSKAEYILFMDPTVPSPSDRPAFPLRGWNITLPYKK